MSPELLPLTKRQNKKDSNNMEDVVLTKMEEMRTENRKKFEEFNKLINEKSILHNQNIQSLREEIGKNKTESDAAFEVIDTRLKAMEEKLSETPPNPDNQKTDLLQNEVRTLKKQLQFMEHLKNLNKELHDFLKLQFDQEDKVLDTKLINIKNM